VHVYRVNPDGTGLRRLSDPTDLSAYPAWSPNGTKIAFHNIPSGTPYNHIYLMNADGTGAINLTNDPEIWQKHPAFYPSGRKIVFSQRSTKWWCSFF
jgi:Tol biopolymer transport system component